VSLKLVLFGVPHRNPMICLKSYNDGNILLTSADAKCCILFGNGFDFGPLPFRETPDSRAKPTLGRS
jgi:hypothetical protein